MGEILQFRQGWIQQENRESIVLTYLVGLTRFERATSTSRTLRATSCATAREAGCKVLHKCRFLQARQSHLLYTNVVYLARLYPHCGVFFVKLFDTVK